MSFNRESIRGMKVTVMGLGLNGGGLESARFFASLGADVTVTDLRDEKILAPTMEALSGLPIRYVLGLHEMKDFSGADLVIKNPAVKRDSPYLGASRHIETDISVFLALNRRPVIAVTGSKGKSTTVSALHFALVEQYPQCDLGGNITVSPLRFIDRKTDDPVILELSSWQLADLRSGSVLNPSVALITNIMHDHMNHYSDLDSYADDKRRIFASQSEEHFTLCNYDDPYGHSFFHETPGNAVFFSSSPLPEEYTGAYLERNEGFFRKHGKHGSLTHILAPDLAIIGEHNRINLLTAAACAFLYGADSAKTLDALSRFPGILHRMEKVAEKSGIRFYNDSAATIPQASIQALASFGQAVHIICGGTDKNCDFAGFAAALEGHTVYLLEGSATEIIRGKLDSKGIAYSGPFPSLEEAFSTACYRLREGDILLLSPGAASFGMFLNEFDRGNRFRKLVEQLA